VPKDAAAGAELPQPCALLDGTRCREYEGRPKRCREFECDLLRAYRRGDLALEVCRERIARLRSFLAAYEGDVGISGSSKDESYRSQLRTEARYLLEVVGLRVLVHTACAGELPAAAEPTIR